MEWEYSTWHHLYARKESLFYNKKIVVQDSVMFPSKQSSNVYAFNVLYSDLPIGINPGMLVVSQPLDFGMRVCGGLHKILSYTMAMIDR